MTTFARLFFPYCLKLTSSPGEGSRYLVLNRSYQPVGLPRASGDHTQREAECAVTLKGHMLLREAGAKIDEESIYLFDDSTAPWGSPANWQRYASLLGILGQAEVTG